MIRKHCMYSTAFAAALTLAIAWPAQAEEAAGADGPNLGRVSLSLASDFVTGYYFRGIAQEAQGLIWQPAVEVGFSLSENSDNLVSSLSLVGGIWGSLHSEGTGAVSGPSKWYEADLYAGIAMTLGDSFSSNVLYTAYTSPNGAFNDVEEVSIDLAYDDSALWADQGLFSLSGFDGFQPYILFAFEVNDQADGGNGNAAGFNEGTYLELGVSPSMLLIDSENQPITMSVPVALGLSLEDYYEFTDSTGARTDESFGYLKVGLLFSTPITAIPSDFGSWEAYAGVDFLFIGESAAQANNTGRDDIGFEVIGSFGISMGY